MADSSVPRPWGVFASVLAALVVAAQMPGAESFACLPQDVDCYPGYCTSNDIGLEERCNCPPNYVAVGLTCKSLTPLQSPPPSPPPPSPAACTTSPVFVLGPAGMQPWGNASIGPTMFPDTTASFIWSSANANLGAPATPPMPTFLKTINVTAAITAYLHIIVDADAEIFLNGARVGGVRCGWTGTKGSGPYSRRPVRLNLVAGVNTLALRCSSTLKNAGLLAAVYGADNTTLLAHTDASWTFYWNGAATVLAKAGALPWGRTNIGASGFPDTRAQWIWSGPATAAAAGDALPRTFVKPFHLLLPRTAKLHIMADSTADVFLNGEKIATVTGGYRAGEYTDRPLPVNLEAGVTFLSIVVRNTDGGSAGLLATLVDAAKPSVVVTRTDSTWAVANHTCA